MAQVSDGGEEEAPDRIADPEPNAIGVPSVGLSLGWVLASRANLRFTRRDRDTVSVARKQEQPRVPVRKAGKGVAKEWPFFVQRTGSTSGCAVTTNDEEYELKGPDAEGRGILMDKGFLVKAGSLARREGWIMPKLIVRNMLLPVFRHREGRNWQTEK
jgi:hypothetical protein